MALGFGDKQHRVKASWKICKHYKYECFFRKPVTIFKRWRISCSLTYKNPFKILKIAWGLPKHRENKVYFYAIQKLHTQLQQLKSILEVLRLFNLKTATWQSHHWAVICMHRPQLIFVSSSTTSADLALRGCHGDVRGWDIGILGRH